MQARKWYRGAGRFSGRVAFQEDLAKVFEKNGPGQHPCQGVVRMEKNLDGFEKFPLPLDLSLAGKGISGLNFAKDKPGKRCWVEAFICRQTAFYGK